GTFDGATCYLVGQAADRAFRRTADTMGIDARIDTAVAALQAHIDIQTRRLTRRIVGVLLAGIAGAVVATVAIIWLLG
ncbi:MAG: hypothetical protein OXQ28_07180, partial [Acidobacteriota bacterium]|nr:hypothetical protein [Acidobacteriota bacterium]